MVPVANMRDLMSYNSTLTFDKITFSCFPELSEDTKLDSYGTTCTINSFLRTLR